MIPPDLVIAGAPRCGTSSLFEWLADHPAVCGSDPKETFFLMDEEHPLRNPEANYHDHGWAGYEAFFARCPEAATLRLEATTHYIYQQTAREALAALREPPHMVFMLREPSERLYSSYRYTRHNKARLQEGVSFANLVERIRAGDDLREVCAQPSAYVLARDLRYGQYADYLARWRTALGEDCLSVILLDEVKRGPQRVVRRLCKRLGLDAAFYDDYDFARENKSVRIRHHGLHRLARRGARWVKNGRLKNAVRRLYRLMQRAGGDDEASPLTDADRRAFAWLRRYFAPHNERLAREFGLDLAAWEKSEDEDAPAASPTHP